MELRFLAVGVGSVDYNLTTERDFWEEWDVCGGEEVGFGDVDSGGVLSLGGVVKVAEVAGLTIVKPVEGHGSKSVECC